MPARCLRRSGGWGRENWRGRVSIFRLKIGRPWKCRISAGPWTRGEPCLRSRRYPEINWLDMQSPRSFDAYLCYHHKDQKYVERIAKRLGELGVSLWFDKSEIGSKDDFVEKMADG